MAFSGLIFIGLLTIGVILALAVVAASARSGRKKKPASGTRPNR